MSTSFSSRQPLTAGASPKTEFQKKDNLGRDTRGDGADLEERDSNSAHTQVPTQSPLDQDVRTFSTTDIPFRRGGGSSLVECLMGSKVGTSSSRGYKKMITSTSRSKVEMASLPAIDGALAPTSASAFQLVAPRHVVCVCCPPLGPQIGPFLQRFCLQSERRKLSGTCQVSSGPPGRDEWTPLSRNGGPERPEKSIECVHGVGANRSPVHINRA